MYLLLISLLILIIAYVYVVYYRIVPMNGISALVLFDSGATRSFVSLALSKRFSRLPEELDCPLDIEIVDDMTVRVTRVHRGCTLRLFEEQFL